MGKVTVPVTNTTITSLWGKSVADNINALPELYGGKATFVTITGGYFDLNFGVTLPWTPTWAVLQIASFDTVARVSQLIVTGYTASKITGAVVDIRAPEAGAPAGWGLTVDYVVGKTRT